MKQTTTDRRNRILLISFSTHWIFHLGTELEILKRHIDQGSEVHLLHCNSSLEACQTNPFRDQQICQTCKLLRKHSLQDLLSTIQTHTLDEYISPSDQRDASSWITTAPAAALTAARYNNADLGWGVVSSTVSITRHPECNSPAAATLLKNFSAAAALTYTATLKFLAAEAPFDTAYIFNGRFATTRAAWRACQEHGLTDIRLHERGCDKNHYDIFPNELPHSISTFRSNATKAWDSLPDEKRLAAGAAFFNERRHGKPQGWLSYTEDQNDGLLPDNFRPNATKIVVFTSSEDEFVAIGDEWQNRCYDTQQQAIETLSSLCHKSLPLAQIFVREHPNAAKSGSRLVETQVIKSNQNCTLIPAESPIDSYALIDASDIVITFGSTMGVEATYWGKPSVTLGPFFGKGLDVTWEAADFDDVLAFLLSPPTARPQINAIKYGAYLQTRGIEFKHFHPTSLLDGVFGNLKLGQRLRSIQLALKLARRLSFAPPLAVLARSKKTIAALDKVTPFVRPILHRLRKVLPFLRLQ